MGGYQRWVTTRFPGIGGGIAIWARKLRDVRISMLPCAGWPTELLPEVLLLHMQVMHIKLAVLVVYIRPRNGDITVHRIWCPVYAAYTGHGTPPACTGI